MLGDLAKKLVNVLVVALALMAFFLVPFGRRTLYQHLKAVFTTREAGELGRELERTSQQVVDEVHRDVAKAKAPSSAGSTPHKP